MKKVLLSIFLSLLIGGLQAQKEVYLKINHRIGNQAFAYNQTATSPENDVYQFTFVQYYIGDIVLTHDGGQTTRLDSTWFLINAEDTTYELLGNININSLEAVSFGVGVNDSYNNNDPFAYPTNHPLAPKSPSMHWGWAAGYFFAAVSGLTGSNLNEGFQVHCLGNTNYFLQTISTTGYESNGDLVIDLDADYNQALAGIDVNPSLFVHADSAEATTLLLNFSNKVFGQSTLGLNQLNANSKQLKVWPNPSEGFFKMSYPQDTKNLEYRIINLNAQETITSGAFTNNKAIEINESGVYILCLYRDNEIVARKKIVVY